jgi:ankyrin repeat protein
MENRDKFNEAVIILQDGLMRAIVNEDWEELYEIILNNGAKIISYTESINYIIKNYICSIVNKITARRQIELLRALIYFGIDFKKIIDSNGYTPLHFVGSNLTIAQYLVYNGGNVNTERNDGETLIHHVIDSEVLQLLINNGANIDKKDTNGITPLHKACSRGNYEIAEMLINNGANINAEDSRNRTPLHYACEYEERSIFQDNNETDTEFIELLLNNGAKISIYKIDDLINNLRKYGNLDIIRLLKVFDIYKSDIDIDYLPDINYSTPILNAAYHNYTDIVLLGTSINKT